MKDLLNFISFDHSLIHQKYAFHACMDKHIFENFFCQSMRKKQSVAVFVEGEKPYEQGAKRIVNGALNSYNMGNNGE